MKPCNDLWTGHYWRATPNQTSPDHLLAVCRWCPEMKSIELLRFKVDLIQERRPR